mmetsp:Transcript_18838/g.43977  ORF Transcript_18838/g.43977 Transcript_18838/m.43977 type:complete len:363 (+) Transcript_18838:2689-3777(+)
MYDIMGYGCHLLPYNAEFDEGHLWAILVFVVIPLGLSIVLISVSMLMVYAKVRNQSRASQRWSLGVSRAGALEQQVFWQCLFHALAFYITWPILFSVYLASVDVNGPLGLSITVAFVAPLQGFSNCLVYLWKSRKPSSLSGSNHSNTRQSMRAIKTKLMASFRRKKTDSQQGSNTSGGSDTMDLSSKDRIMFNPVEVDDPVLELSHHLSASMQFRPSGSAPFRPKKESEVKSEVVFEACRSSEMVEEDKETSGNDVLFNSIVNENKDPAIWGIRGSVASASSDEESQMKIAETDDNATDENETSKNESPSNEETIQRNVLEKLRKGNDSDDDEEIVEKDEINHSDELDPKPAGQQKESIEWT